MQATVQTRSAAVSRRANAYVSGCSLKQLSAWVSQMRGGFTAPFPSAAKQAQRQTGAEAKLPGAAVKVMAAAFDPMMATSPAKIKVRE